MLGGEHLRTEGARVRCDCGHAVCAALEAHGDGRAEQEVTTPGWAPPHHAHLSAGAGRDLRLASLLLVERLC